ncbi:MAG: helix-hairpin-helix domain-containing protein [Anaerolineaceae bacterium]|nr:helix-hairpin-helix domain-containing protein [Anaerolineaceae bacterium]
MNAKTTHRVDVNQADLQDLAAIPRLNAATAAMIYEKRPFERIEDLLEIKGIVPRLLELLRPYLKISPMDINTASAEQLTAIPRLSPTLAARIIDGRPYEKLEEIKNLKGIGPRFYAHLQPYLEIFLEPLETEEPIIDEPEASLEPEDIIDVAEEPIELFSAEEDDDVLVAVGKTTKSIFTPAQEPVEEAPAVRDASQPEVMSVFSRAIQVIAPERFRSSPSAEEREKTPGHSEMLAWIAGGSILTLILAIIFSLGILGLVNGGLQFKSQREAELDAASLQNKIEELSIQAGDLQEDIVSLRTRLDDMDNLSGRISEVESQNEALQTELDEFTDQIGEFQGQIDLLSEQMDQVQETSNSFEDFLKELQSLLNEILPISEP